MSKNKNQKGSAALVIIVILVLGLVGTLGYVAYDKFIVNAPVAEEETIPAEEEQLSNSDIEVHDVDNETDSETEDSTDNATTTTETNSEAKYIISQWGVKGVLGGAYTAQYEISTNTHLTFTSRDLTGSCSGVVVGNIYRLGADDEYPSYSPSPQTVEQIFTSGNEQQKSSIKHIGSYYYVYISPQDACVQTGSTTPDPIFVSAHDSVHALFSTLVAV